MHADVALERLESVDTFHVRFEVAELRECVSLEGAVAWREVLNSAVAWPAVGTEFAFEHPCVCRHTKIRVRVHVVCCEWLQFCELL